MNKEHFEAVTATKSLYNKFGNIKVGSLIKFGILKSPTSAPYDADIYQEGVGVIVKKEDSCYLVIELDSSFGGKVAENYSNAKEETYGIINTQVGPVVCIVHFYEIIEILNSCFQKVPHNT